ncbi:MAG: DUF6148 family protein [Candidatus Cloacimonetes bacterium]|nr:DUF6148 family protein [Candidatus Cloacimonadota bacterium]
MKSRINNERLAQYLEAEKAVLSGQSYTIGNRQFTRASLSVIRKAIDDLLDAGATLGDTEVNLTRKMSKRVVFVD